MSTPYDGRGRTDPPWWPSRYGEMDRLGSGNELTPERTLRALRIPREGRTLNLAQTVERGVPAVYPREWRQLILTHGLLGNPDAPRGCSRESWVEEEIASGNHIGCHVDALGHLGIDGHFYNGLHYRDFVTATGLTQLGIETARPWVCRGVCLDIAGLVGSEPLEEGFVVTPDHLEDACERQGVEVQAGDAVLLHTGWGALYGADPDRYAAAEPGAGWDAAHRLTDRRVSLVGADNWAFEVLPFEYAEREFCVHQHLLAETGTHILENIDTAALASGGHSEFLFLLTVPKLKGATAAPAGPVAVV
jgi:kynurenine formamidase